MRTLRFFAVSGIGILAASILLAQDVENSDESFILKLHMTHATDEISNDTIVVKAGAKTDIPIRRTVKLDNGGSASFVGNLSLFVPSPALMSHLGPEANPETTEVGPKLTCRVRRGPEDQRLLDVELTETQAEKHSPQDGVLVCTTRQLRSVQSVRPNKSVTLSWPADEHGKVSRRVTVTIEE